MTPRPAVRVDHDQRRRRRPPRSPPASASAIGLERRDRASRGGPPAAASRARPRLPRASGRPRTSRPCGTGRSRRPSSSSSAMASVVGASVGFGQRQVDAGSGRAPSRRMPPNRSVDRRPRNATSTPSRPIVRAVLNGPPPGTAAEPSVGMDEEVDECLAGDDDHATHRTGATYAAPMERRTDAVELLDGPLDDPAALAGNLRDLRRINRWLGGVRLSADAIDALAAHRERADRCSTSGPAAPTSRWRSSTRADGTGSRARRRRHRQPARGPRRGRRWRGRPWPRRRASSSTSATVARSPTPTARSTSPTPRWSSTTSRPTRRFALLREMARVARLGVVVNDLDRSRLGWIGAWLIGHLLTGNRYTRHDAPLSVLRSYRADEMTGAAADGRADAGPHGTSARSASATRSRPCRRPGTIRIGDAAGSAGSRRVTAQRETRPVERVGIAIVGGGPAGAVLAARLADAGRRGRRPRAGAGLALAGGRRLHVARRGRGAATRRARRGDAGDRGAADPRDARRDAVRARRSA